MRTINRPAVLGALAALSMLGGVSGCIIHHEDDGYRYEHGDRIDRYGNREERWCEHHPEDGHCH